MSNTRRKVDDGPASQERYMSSYEYVELRGINGGPVAAKAETVLNPKKRSLLFFIQGRSLMPGGLKQFAKEFLEEFLERLGSPRMHALGVTPGRMYKPEVVKAIREELGVWDFRKEFGLSPNHSHFGLDDADDIDSMGGETLVGVCRQLAEQQIVDFLTQLCIDPRLGFRAEGDTDRSERREREKRDETEPARYSYEHRFYIASVPWFEDIIGALFEYQMRYAAAALGAIAKTEVSEKVFEPFNYCLRTRKMVAIYGNSRIGKTAAAEAWVNAHLGEARFVSLSGISNKTSVFRAIAKSLGLACSYTRTTTDMQARIEDFLERSGLLLVIDEAHFLLGQGVRIYSRPELLDWIDTALYNHGVPCALVSTPQFAVRLGQVERQTGWNAEQFKGRVKRWDPLPERPCKEDLEAVARHLLPEANNNTVKLIAAYALRSRREMPAVVDAIDDARLVAEQAGRSKVIFEDVRRAIEDYRMPSDTAQARAFESTGKPPRKSSCRSPENGLQAPCKDGSGELNGEDFPGHTASLALPSTVATRKAQEQSSCTLGMSSEKAIVDWGD